MPPPGEPHFTVAQLAKQLAERKKETGQPVRGLISICAAGGQGVAAILEA